MLYITKIEIEARLKEIDKAFISIKDYDSLHTDKANELRDEWVYLYNKLASFKKKQ